MATIIGVKFRCASKLYYFDPLEEEFVSGDRVIVETARGVEMGRVVVPNREVDDEEVVSPLKTIIRKATEKDLENEVINKSREPEAFRICKEKIRAHELEMKLVAVEYTFDGSKVLFYFTADGRVDFRELVKDLASTFRTRIELRQIGVRDEAKIKGGIGICGRPLCCSSYLCDFVPVSIKMAKEQNLSLNPTKISGCCGRLMCCLKNEEETYEVLNSQLPSVGDAVTVKGERTRGTVQSVNVLRQKVRVLISAKDGDTEVEEYDVERLQFEKGRRTFPAEEEPEELRELEELEEREEAEQQEETSGLRRNDRGRNRQRDRRRERPEQGGEERAKDGQRGDRDRRSRRNRTDNAEDRDGEERGHDRNRGREEGRSRDENRNREEGRSRDENRNREEGRSRDENRNREDGRSRDENGERSERRERRERPARPRRPRTGEAADGAQQPAEERERPERTERTEREAGEGRSRSRRRRPPRPQNGEGAERPEGEAREKRPEQPDGEAREKRPPRSRRRRNSRPQDGAAQGDHTAPAEQAGSNE